MPQAERTVVIGADIDTVYAFFTDPANDRAWRPGVQQILADGQPAVGSIVHQTIAGPLNRGVAADIEITDYEPGARYGFKAVAGPVRPVGLYAFSSTGAGTSVTFSLRCDLGGLKGLLMGRQVQRSMDAEMAALDTAKSLLEA